MKTVYIGVPSYNCWQPESEDSMRVAIRKTGNRRVSVMNPEDYEVLESKNVTGLKDVVPKNKTILEVD